MDTIVIKIWRALTRSPQNRASPVSQLAAERSGSLGFLIRSIEMRRKPCWSTLRMGVTRNFEKLLLELLHVRGGKLDHESRIEVAL